MHFLASLEAEVLAVLARFNYVDHRDAQSVLGKVADAIASGAKAVASVTPGIVPPTVGAALRI